MYPGYWDGFIFGGIGDKTFIASQKMSKVYGDGHPTIGNPSGYIDPYGVHDLSPTIEISGSLDQDVSFLFSLTHSDAEGRRLSQQMMPVTILAVSLTLPS